MWRHRCFARPWKLLWEGWVLRRPHQLPSAMNPIAERLRAAPVPPTALDLAYTPAGPHLAELDGLAELHTLQLGYAGVDAAALVTLGRLALPGLRLLDLMGLGLQLTRAGYEARARREDVVVGPTATAAMLGPLLASGWIDGLQTLVLSHCSLDASACRALGKAPLPALETLVLIGTTLGDPAALLAGDKPSLRWIEGGPFPPSALLRSPVLGRLTHLRVQLRKPTDDAVASIVAGMPAARELRLNHVGGGPRALAALAASTAPLEGLYLQNNELTDEAVAPLWSAAWMATVQALSLSRNELGDPSLDALLAAPLPATAKVGLRDNRFSDAGWARLQARFGDRAVGAGTQRRPLPRTGDAHALGAGRIALTQVDGPAPRAPWKKLPEPVAAVGLAVEAASGTAGWYVGEDEGHAVLVSARGERLDPAVPAEGPVLAVVDGEAGVAFVLVGDAGIHRVVLATGEAQQVGSCDGHPLGGALVPDGVAVLYGSVASHTAVEVFGRDGASRGCVALPAWHQVLAAQDGGRLLVAGVGEYGVRPVSIVEVQADGSPVATTLPGEYTVVGLPDAPLLQAGPTLFAVTRVG